MLHRGCVWGAADGSQGGGGSAIENRLCRFAASDGVGHRIGVLLVRVSRVPDSVAQLHAIALLYDVRSFVRRQPNVWRIAERDAIAHGVAKGTHPLVGGGRRAADLRPHAAHVATAERRLDPIEVGKRLLRRLDAALGNGMDG